MIHRIETNKLRNVAKFFAHLLGTFALPWHYKKYCDMQQQELGLKICIKYFIKFNLISTICHKYFVKRVI